MCLPTPSSLNPNPDPACLQICSLDFKDASVDALLAYMKSQSASFEELLDQRRGTRQAIAAWQVRLVLPAVSEWCASLGAQCVSMQLEPSMAGVLLASSLLVAM